MADFRKRMGTLFQVLLALAVAHKSSEFSQPSVQPAAALDSRPTKPSDHDRVRRSFCHIVIVCESFKLVKLEVHPNC